MLEENVSSTTMPSSIWESMNSWFTPTVLFVLLNLMIGTIAFTSTLTNQKQKNQENRQPQNQQPPMLARSPSVLQRLRSINFYAFRPQETSHFKSPPDSHNLHHTHQPQILESQTHYIFGHTHQESPNLETHHPTHHIFRQENHEQTQTHHQSQQENQTHHIFRQENHQQTQTHHFFRQENQTHHQFQQENQSQFLPNQNKPEETHAHFDAQEEEEETDELQSMDEIYSRLKGKQVNRCKSDTKPSSGEMPARLPAKMKKSASMKSAFNHFGEKAEDVEPRRPATTRERAAPVDHEVDAKADDFINRFKQQLKLQRLDSILRYKEMIGRGAGR
ncbi:pathogen-associated molecular patterns-induced protein A70-like [Ipomoea triloba]|uniref:pathogen-associated molecular patterns-induced protein A70-like n=1 Tax=Ipomoea triloba TaxID=35885 RepID=UPI00125E471B|nr:pathogen-associated molecular patterns-induced protein A70-like [Ipomoea triloba]